MTNSSTININGMGPILLEHSRRAKHVRITIAPFKGIRVTVPARVSFKKAMEFVYLKQDWLHRHLEKVRQYEDGREILPDASLHINRAEATEKLTGRLKHLAEKHGFTFGKVSVRNQKTRWGSCSTRNNISLNMKLVRLPEELVDYVILHELVHTRKKDHSRSFWGELDQYVGRGKDLAKRLREYGGVLL